MFFKSFFVISLQWSFFNFKNAKINIKWIIVTLLEKDFFKSKMDTQSK